MAETARTHPVDQPARQRPRRAGRPKYSVWGVYIYTRISDPRDRRTTERQRSRAVEYVRDNINAPILEVFVDVRSGFLRRKQYEQMMAQARLGLCSHIVLYDFDRFGRDRLKMLHDFNDLEVLQIEVHDCTNGHITHEMAGQKALQAENELRATSRRVTDGMLDRARTPEVYPMPRRAPIGYIPTPGKPGEPQKDPRYADLVTQAFERYDQGESEAAIARWWNEQTGGKKRGTSINAMLRNEYYAGIAHFNRTSNSKLNPAGRYVKDESDWITRHHDLPLVDRSLFDRVQAKLDRNEQRGHKYDSEPQHSLTGLIDCTACGGRLVVRGPRGRHQGDVCCDVCGISRSYKRVEATLRLMLEEIPLRTQDIALVKIDTPTQDVETINAQIRAIREARGRVMLQHELGNMNDDDYTAFLAETDTRISALEGQLGTVAASVHTQVLAHETAMWLASLSNWTEILDVDTATPASKNRVYRQCCDRVSLDFATDTLTVTWCIGVATQLGVPFTRRALVARQRAASRIYGKNKQRV